MSDNNSGFSGSNSNIRKVVQEIISAVDCTFYTAKNLEAKVSSMLPRNLLYLPNGVDLARFSIPSEVPALYQRLKGPIAVFAGSFGHWFDTALVQEAAIRLPQVNFVLIGPVNTAIKRLSQIPNVHCIGSLPQKKLPPYYQHANVGMIPFDVTASPLLVNAINPVKLYEYAACGLPTVTMDWQELSHIDLPIIRCKTKEEFIYSLEHTIQAETRIPNTTTSLDHFDWQQTLSPLLDWLAKEGLDTI